MDLLLLFWPCDFIVCCKTEAHNKEHQRKAWERGWGPNWLKMLRAGTCHLSRITSGLHGGNIQYSAVNNFWVFVSCTLMKECVLLCHTSVAASVPRMTCVLLLPASSSQAADFRAGNQKTRKPFLEPGVWLHALLLLSNHSCLCTSVVAPVPSSCLPK